MEILRNTLIDCKNCQRKIMIKPSDFERGEIYCTHKGCNFLNKLGGTYYFDENIVKGLPNFGRLIYENNPTYIFSLKFGQNIIGTSSNAQVHVERFTHDGKCFISRQHCTLEVSFDKWAGRLRYKLFDGFRESNGVTYQKSLNGIFLNDLFLKESEIIDVTNAGIITLGKIDKFRLESYEIPPVMLETYQIKLDFDPERTQ